MRVRWLSTDALVNIVILVTCVIVGSAVISQWRSRQPTEASPPFAVGDHAESLPGVSYQDAELSVVLYLKSSCVYCAASMPFYRRLADVATKRGGSVIAVSSEPTDLFSQYLSANGLTAAKAVQFKGRVAATPTVVFVNKAGQVTRVVIGQQSPDAEAGVIGFIRGS